MAPSATKSAKKRKHEASSQDTSSTQYKVEVTPNDPAHDPIVVSFPRGVPSSLIHHDDDNNDTASSSTQPVPRFTYSKLKSTSDKGRTITGSDDTCTYFGSSSGKRNDGRLTKLYVVAVNKKAKTLTLIPAAEQGTIFSLEQSVKSYKPLLSDSAMLGGGNMAAKDRVNLLVESFGSKKKQKVMSSRAANIVNINNVVGAGDVMMDSVVNQNSGEGMVISEENREILMDGKKVVNNVEASLLEARKQILPPFDRNADTPSKIYNPIEIAGENCWNQISRLVDKTLKNAPSEDWIENLLVGKGSSNKPNTKTYIPDSISNLFSSLNPHEKSHILRIKTSFFLYFLLRFHHKMSTKKTLMGSDHEECVRQTRSPSEVGCRLIELFTVPIEGNEKSGYMITPRLLEKLQLHILILYVISSGGMDMAVSSVNQLLKDVKLDERRAMMCYREAGFTVKKNGKKEIGVSLSVPLTFPPPKRGKK